MHWSFFLNWARKQTAFLLGNYGNMVSNIRVALLLLACTALLLSGCARPGAALLNAVDLETKPKSIVAVYAAAYLSAAPEGSSDDVVVRSRLKKGFAKFTISVPKNHKDGHVELPVGSKPDSARHFAVVVDPEKFEEPGFYQAIGRDTGPHHSSNRDVFVFVHGYNNNFQEALFRMAQLLEDSDTHEPSVLFAWPSFARVLNYSADRERVMASRNYLEHVLNNLARTPHLRKIHIVGHSMGSLLVMETLRQASFKSQSCRDVSCTGAPFLGKLGRVALVAPDIDISVFKTQLSDVGVVASHIHIVIAKDDLALAASRRLAGGLPRVGNPDPDTKKLLEQLLPGPKQVIELKNIQGCDPLNHSNFACAIRSLKEQVRSAAR
jgi:esterase/lipase superfamily enzyme